MSILELCERIQQTALSEAISQSTWGYPIVGALHVLAIALAGGAILVVDLRALGLAFPHEDRSQLAFELRRLKWAGLLVVTLTGILLFVAQPVQSYSSVSFRLKLVLLALITLNASIPRRSAWLSLALWAAVIFAARGIAFY